MKAIQDVSPVRSSFSVGISYWVWVSIIGAFIKIWCVAGRGLP